MKQKKGQSHRIKKLPQPISILAYCVDAFPILGSKTAVKKAIATGRLFHNGALAEYGRKVKQGDLLELKGAAVSIARSFDLPIEIVYEDEHLLVANKPAGIAVNGNRIKTLENALATKTRNNRQTDALPRPVAVHRIDVPTNGLVVLAKTKSALILLSKAFQNQQVQKQYLAIVHGQIADKGRIDTPLSGKKALTQFERLEVVPSRVFQHLSLVALFPKTGRTHQLRLHLKEEGHLILGDKAYAEHQKTILGKGLFLCACALQFAHPHSKEQIELRIDPPAKFHKVLKREAARFHS